MVDIGVEIGVGVSSREVTTYKYFRYLKVVL